MRLFNNYYYTKLFSGAENISFEIEMVSFYEILWIDKERQRFASSNTKHIKMDVYEFAWFYNY